MAGWRRKATAYYDLKNVQKHVQDMDCHLITSKALECAYQDFGWDHDEIVLAISRLKPKHFYKSEESRFFPGVIVDYYRARRLNGEGVYVHFHYDEEGEMLIVNSFKRLEVES